MTEIEETSKAIAEAAKFGTKALDSGDKLGGFLSNVFGVSIENAVGLMGDKLEYMRWERRIRMVDKVNAFNEERGLTTFRPIPPKFAIPLIENASLEEDDNLQDIWCRLIANNLDSNYDFEMRYAFIDMVKSLTLFDAKLLRFFYDRGWEESHMASVFALHGTRYLIFKDFTKRHIQQQMDCTNEELDLSVNNLIRLQCLTDSTSLGFLPSLEKPSIEMDYLLREYSLTSLGFAFIEACIK